MKIHLNTKSDCEINVDDLVPSGLCSQVFTKCCLKPLYCMKTFEILVHLCLTALCRTQCEAVVESMGSVGSDLTHAKIELIQIRKQSKEKLQFSSSCSSSCPPTPSLSISIVKYGRGKKERVTGKQFSFAGRKHFLHQRQLSMNMVFLNDKPYIQFIF